MAVTPVRHVPDAERLARLGWRHLLAPGHQGSDATSVAGALAGLHATEYASAVLSAWARAPHLTPADVEREEDVSPAERQQRDGTAARLTDLVDGRRVFSVYPSAAMKG